MPLSRVRPEEYEDLLKKKVNLVCSQMEQFALPTPHICPSQPLGFRLRAEFRIWHEGETVDFVMFRNDQPRVPVRIQEFPIVDERIQHAMRCLRDILNSNEFLRRKLFQVEFITSLAGDLLITLIYHRKLDKQWEKAAQLLNEELRANALTASIIGRSRKQKLVIGKDYIEEVLAIHGTDYRYRQYEQAFSQPNGLVNIKMIEWACSQSATLVGDLLELYCGNGNFTLPLAQYFEAVVATELSKTSIRAARENIVENGAKNVHLIRLSAEEVTQAINEERVFRRLKELPKPLHDFDLNTLFVDPPRAGLDDHTVTMATRFPWIIYISCNPNTLVGNLHTLHKSHSIEQFALFDQFPYTDHMECGVLLNRR
ncbi:MAG: tRNA (uridine(54)-C5)-methyltransferase TrmA [Halioglobus sp.]